jgi:hypothetical protein
MRLQSLSTFEIVIFRIPLEENFTSDFAFRYLEGTCLMKTVGSGKVIFLDIVPFPILLGIMKSRIIC